MLSWQERRSLEYSKRNCFWTRFKTVDPIKSYHDVFFGFFARDFNDDFEVSHVFILRTPQMILQIDLLVCRNSSSSGVDSCSRSNHPQKVAIHIIHREWTSHQVSLLTKLPFRAPDSLNSANHRNFLQVSREGFWSSEPVLLLRCPKFIHDRRHVHDRWDSYCSSTTL